MSDRIVVLKDGKAAQIGTPEEIYLTPDNSFVAKFFRGGNVIDAHCLGAEGNEAAIVLADLTFKVARRGRNTAVGPCSVAIRAESIAIGEAARSYPLRMTVRLRSRIFRGANADWQIELPGGAAAVVTTQRQVMELPDRTVEIGFRPQDVILLQA